MYKKIFILFTIIKLIITIDESNIYNSTLKKSDLFGEYYDKAREIFKNMSFLK